MILDTGLSFGVEHSVNLGIHNASYNMMSDGIGLVLAPRNDDYCSGKVVQSLQTHVSGFRADSNDPFELKLGTQNELSFLDNMSRPSVLETSVNIDRLFGSSRSIYETGLFELSADPLSEVLERTSPSINSATHSYIPQSVSYNRYSDVAGSCIAGFDLGYDRTIANTSFRPDRYGVFPHENSVVASISDRSVYETNAFELNVDPLNLVFEARGFSNSAISHAYDASHIYSVGHSHLAESCIAHVDSVFAFDSKNDLTLIGNSYADRYQVIGYENQCMVSIGSGLIHETGVFRPGAGFSDQIFGHDLYSSNGVSHVYNHRSVYSPYRGVDDIVHSVISGDRLGSIRNPFCLDVDLGNSIISQRPGLPVSTQQSVHSLVLDNNATACFVSLNQFASGSVIGLKEINLSGAEISLQTIAQQSIAGCNSFGFGSHENGIVSLHSPLPSKGLAFNKSLLWDSERLYSGNLNVYTGKGSSFEEDEQDELLMKFGNTISRILNTGNYEHSTQLGWNCTSSDRNITINVFITINGDVTGNNHHFGDNYIN